MCLSQIMINKHVCLIEKALLGNRKVIYLKARQSEYAKCIYKLMNKCLNAHNTKVYTSKYDTFRLVIGTCRLVITWKQFENHLKLLYKILAEENVLIILKYL